MQKKTVYQCGKCGKVVEVFDAEKSVITCCGIKMRNLSKMSNCQSSVTAEHERLKDADQPCDDSVN